MNTIQLNEMLKTCPITRKNFRGVYASDEVPHHLSPLPGFIIINTDPSYCPGLHWFAIYIWSPKLAWYFDSYGKPPELKLPLLHKIKRIIYNKIPVQSVFATTCGQHTLFFLLFSITWYMLQRYFIKILFYIKCVCK